MSYFAGLLGASLVLGPQLILAQSVPQPQPNSYRVQRSGSANRERLVSPEVHSDGRITFRVRVAGASGVNLLFGAWNPRTIAMTNAGEGLWTVTVGPVEPEIYTYVFSIDGVRTLDLANSQLKIGRGLDASVVEVPGSPPRFDEVQDVAQGAIHIRSYRSSPLKRLRRLYVYVPPEYDTEPNLRFPVLYLRHGGGDDESNWCSDGRAGVILENLLARKKAVPMLIVMTNGHTDGTWAGGSSREGMELLSRELLGDVIPFIEKSYRTLPGRENRAITGLSMGGGQAFTIGLRHLDNFAWVGEFSSGLVSDADFDIEKQVPRILSDPASINRKLRLFFLSCGTDDPRYQGQLNLSALLKENGISHEFHDTPGGHEWKVWRHLLAVFLQKVFQPAA